VTSTYKTIFDAEPGVEYAATARLADGSWLSNAGKRLSEPFEDQSAIHTVAPIERFWINSFEAAITVDSSIEYQWIEVRIHRILENGNLEEPEPFYSGFFHDPFGRYLHRPIYTREPLHFAKA